MSTSTAPSRRRRFPWWVVGLLFVVVPLLEIWTIIQVGQVVGAWWTRGLLVLSGVLGSWLVKREGGRAMRAFREALAAGRLPHRELADGILVAVKTEYLPERSVPTGRRFAFAYTVQITNQSGDATADAMEGALAHIFDTVESLERGK